MNERHVRSITLADDDWMPAGDNGNHLTAILVINGTFHHLDAIRVYEDDAGQQRAEAPQLEAAIDGMYQIGADGPFDTVSIRGESYLLVVVPFQ